MAVPLMPLTTLNIKNIAATLLHALIVTITASLVTPNIAWCSQKVDVDKWEEDIAVYQTQLKQGHLNLFHASSEKAFDQKLNLLRSQLPRLSDNEILVALMQLTNTIGDGHTAFPLWGAPLHKFPFKFIAVDGKFYVSETTDENVDLFEAELLSINGKPIDAVATMLSETVPFAENQYSTSVRIAQYLPVAEVLNGLGIVDDKYVAEFTFNIDGETSTVTLKALETQTMNLQLSLDHFRTKAPIKPTSGQYNRQFASSNKTSIKNGKKYEIKQATQWLWFTHAKQKNTVYVKFERYPEMSTMEHFAKELLQFINNNKSESLIIDLRNNYGGDFFVGLKLAQYLVMADSLHWQDGIYVLINNVTFSAAMSNAAQYKRLLNATLVGEPTGAKPRGYQDMGQFTLPHSKRVVSYSKRFYDFSIGSKKGTEASNQCTDLKNDAIYPDKLISLSIEDYFTNTDKQIQWVLEQIKWK